MKIQKYTSEGNMDAIKIIIYFYFFFVLQARQTLSALRQQKEEENHSQQQSGGNHGHGSATAELLRIKDHLIDVEKNVRFMNKNKMCNVQYFPPSCIVFIIP